MTLEIKEVNTKKDFRSFINLPYQIHKAHPNWVPPIYSDDLKFFNSKKNDSFSSSDTLMLIAKHEKLVVGRIMGIIHHKYNMMHQAEEGRFCFLETHEDFSVAFALINRIELWAKENGMKKLIGPLGFSDKDPQGFLVEGFNEPVVIATNCNFPFMIRFMEKAGYTKKIDLVVYKLMIPEVFPLFYKNIHTRVTSNNKSIRLINFSSRRQLRPYVKPVFELLNETFKDIFAFSPLNDKEMKEFANRYLFILDPKFIKVIENENKELLAFILSMPDISEGIKKCKGKVLPFGLFHILRSQKKTGQLNLLLGGIKPAFRNLGLDSVLGISLLEEAKKAGLKVIDSHLILENNTKMRAEVEKMGGVVYKRYRIFEKTL
ncbi:MAG: hypothetical protein JXB24_08945 [Bacteroidales bacterium]|nr:hypothetical protein [Bacteroidales bacterium]